MAKKKYIPQNKPQDGLKPEERVAKTFAEMLIEKLEGAQLDWKKPWFSNMNMGAPQNFEGRKYGGLNQFYLSVVQEKNGYQLPVWITFHKAKELGANINKGEAASTVWLGSRIIKDENGNKISNKDYENLSAEEKQRCTIIPFAKAYAVFNIQQTNYPEIHPEAYAALKEKLGVRHTLDETGMIQCPEMDHMLEHQSWLCPIECKQQDQAYYSISKDAITVPLKGQFVNGESFYKTLLHEMAHSTGAESRLGRIKPSGFGSAEYAREELVAEMTAAVVANTLGMNSCLKEDSIPYLQSWLKSLKEEPKFMLTLMKDVNRACQEIERNIYNKVLKIDMQEENEISQVTEKEKDVAVDEEQHQMAVPEQAHYSVLNEPEPQKQQEKKLHMAYLGNGISVWEDGDMDYTGHISEDRTVRMDKSFSAENEKKIRDLAEYGNRTNGRVGEQQSLILEPLNMATHRLYNTHTGESYPVSVETLSTDKGDRVYCTGKQVWPQDMADRMVEMKMPDEYVFSVKGLDNVRPQFIKLAAQGMDVSEMQSMLETADDIVRSNAISREEIDNKVLYFHVKDNSITKFNRMVEELGAELPLYHISRNAFVHDSPVEGQQRSDAQILAGDESIIRIRGTQHFEKAVGALAQKGIAVLPKIEEEMKLFARMGQKAPEGDRESQALYLMVKGGVVVDSEPRIDEKQYDLPKFVYDGTDIVRFNGQAQDKNLNQTNNNINSLNNSSMENSVNETKKELKDGIYLFPMKSGDYGINEVKNGQATPTIRIPKDSPELSAFFESVKGKDKNVRNTELAKFAEKFLTPENIAAAQERKAQRAQGEGTEKKDTQYLHLPKLKPEIAERIANVRTFKMKDGVTMAVSADIDGAHMTKPMGDKLQNTFYAKAKGTTGEAKKELDMAVAAMAFHKELSAPKEEQQQSAGMKR